MSDCQSDLHARVAEHASEVLVVVNPKAGARPGRPIVDELIGSLTNLDYRVEVFDSIEGLSEVAAARLADGSLRAVVAAGGDGTVSMVANQTPPGTPLLTVPLGTENLLARYLNVPRDAERICRILREGHCLRLDAGRANDRLFLLMVGCGFDAEVVRRLDHQRTGNISRLSYIKPILQSIRSYEYPELRIYSESSDTPQVARWAFAVNVPRYAARLIVAPDALGTDGLLDVCTFRGGSLCSGLLYVAGVVTGLHRKLADYTRVRTARVRIESDTPVPYQLDGDPGGVLPVDIEVLPKRLTLIAPQRRIETMERLQDRAQ
jgi:diacylglycerol kinase family enzyme